MPLVTVQQLQQQLDWPIIREESLPEYGMRLFSAVPADESLPSIEFLFDDKVEFLQQLGSGEWHYHPELDDAVEVARKLIHHELCILDERRIDGGQSCAAAVAPDEVLGSLHLDADHFVRRFFGRPPVREEIDFSRYVKGQHLYLEVKRKAESDALWASLGKPPPEF
jgi:hypothetical protein